MQNLLNHNDPWWKQSAFAKGVVLAKNDHLEKSDPELVILLAIYS